MSNNDIFFKAQGRAAMMAERQKVVAERINGQLAMLGLVAASFSYITTGHMFFGLV